MENNKVKLLREKYGIGDSRNEYSESDIENIITSKVHYFAFRVDEDGVFKFDKKTVLAYISKDNCIWLKDKDINRGYECYMPVVTERTYKVVEDGIYTYYDGYCRNVYLCFGKDYDYCLSLVKEAIYEKITEMVREYQKIIDNLFNLVCGVLGGDYD